MAVVSMSYLLEAGVHFGHQTKRWNPKMKEYIYNSRDDIYIIDLQKTVEKLEEAYAALTKIVSDGGKVLFVGTKKQAAEVCREEAKRSGMYYMAERWLGGTLTNFGIREMTRLPQAVIIVDSIKEENAIREAKKLGIPTFGIIDTNCDPDLVDYAIPGNDDAVRAIKVVLGSLTNAIVEVNGGTLVDYVTEDPTKKPRNFDKKEHNNNKYSNQKQERRNFKPNKEKQAEKQEKAKEDITEKKLDLNILTVAELRELAKKKEIKGYSKMKKEELIENLK